MQKRAYFVWFQTPMQLRKNWKAVELYELESVFLEVDATQKELKGKRFPSASQIPSLRARCNSERIESKTGVKTVSDAEESWCNSERIESSAICSQSGRSQQPRSRMQLRKNRKLPTARTYCFPPSSMQLRKNWKLVRFFAGVCL